MVGYYSIRSIVPSYLVTGTIQGQSNHSSFGGLIHRLVVYIGLAVWICGKLPVVILPYQIPT